MRYRFQSYFVMEIKAGAMRTTTSAHETLERQFGPGGTKISSSTRLLEASFSAATWEEPFGSFGIQAYVLQGKCAYFLITVPSKGLVITHDLRHI